MIDIKQLDQSNFLNKVIEDGEIELKNIKVLSRAVEMPKDQPLTEKQYYIHKVGFCLLNTLVWRKQLDYGIEFLLNFNYSKSKDMETKRADHFIYNVENFYIRLQSIQDRILQLINAVFHLCINEEHVRYGIILNNYKVKRCNEVCLRIKAIKKYLDEHVQLRHTLIHKHSLQDADLKKVSIFHFNDFEHINNKTVREIYKDYRTQHLRKKIKDKKTEFQGINYDIKELLDRLLKALLPEYQKQLKRLKRIENNE